MRECPDCASMNVFYSELRDQIICRDCGVIFEPLAPELEKKFERTHGLTLSTAPKRKRKTSKLKTNKTRKTVKKKTKKKKVKKKTVKKKKKKR